MSVVYKDFNSNNCSPLNCELIGVYNEKKRLVGVIRVPPQMIIPNATKLYSFMHISDSHVRNVVGDDGSTDLERAINYANKSDVAFVTHSGDTADSGTDWHLSKFKEIIDKCNKPVYPIAGNHETITGNGNIELGYNSLTSYLGHPLYYSFEHENNVFIMLGESGYTTGNFFIDGELQFMYEELEANRNKLCFVIQHVPTLDDEDSGNPNNFYDSDLFNTGENAVYRQKEKQCFVDMLKHYKNTVWISGHTHALLELQSIESWANYSEKLGYRSLHASSITKPKDENGNAISEKSQGYIIDVYENFIVVKGRDFVQGKYLPIATYMIDTALVNIEANTFVDTTGIITK